MIIHSRIRLWLPFLLLSTILNASLIVAQPTLRSRQGPADQPNNDNAIPGSVDFTDEEGNEGSSGESKGSVNLSTGAQVAIIVVAVVVAVLGVASAVLYYLAKKRQWEVRASIRRSARRVAESIKSPITGTAPQWPRTPRTPRTPKPTTHIPSKETPRIKTSILKDSSQKSTNQSSSNVPKKGQDLEKGLSKSSSAESDLKARELPGWKKVFR